MSRYARAAALAVLLASGCSDEHAGSLPPTAPPVTSVAATPSRTPEQQIEAAVRTYFATLEKAGRTGDVSALAPLVSVTCACRRQVTAIRADAKAGRHATTTYAIEDVRPHAVTGSTGAAVVTYSSPASRLVDRNGHTVRTFPARQHAGVDLSFRVVGTTWVLERLVDLGA